MIELSLHKYRILCQFPNKVKMCDQLPVPPPGCTWYHEGINSNGLQTYRLVIPVVNVTFITASERKILPSNSIKDGSKLPDIPPRIGYTSFWPIPDEIITTDLEIEPVYQIIQKKIIFQYKNKSSFLNKIVRLFTIENPKVSPPHIDYLPPGFKSASWEPYDTSILEDQVANAIYEPILIRYHMPDGNIVECKYTELQQNDPPILDDDVWPEIQLHNSDIDVYPEPKLHFALFYERNQLKFCVPFTRDDDHYVDEILTKNRPRKGMIFINWTLLDEDQDIRRYICDYPVSPNIGNDRIDWSFENVPKNEDTLRSVPFSSHNYNIFKTDFTKYTGFNEDNLNNYRPLKLREWLRKYEIPYEDSVLSWDVKENKDGPYVYISRGRFIVEYSETTEGYVDYLQESDILFEKYRKKTVTINGKEAYHLRAYAPLDYDDDPGKVFSEEVMHNTTLIPPFSYPNTDYTRIKIKSVAAMEIENSPQRSLEERMRENAETANIVNSDYDPDLKYRIINNENKTVEIIGYNGMAYHYDIPSMIQTGSSTDSLYTVTKIGTAFYGSHLVKVSIPDTVTEIGEEAFADCESLISIELSENLVTIGPSAFDGCRKLKSIDLPASLKSIGQNALLPVRNIYCRCSPETIPTNSYRSCWCKIHIIQDEDDSENAIDEMLTDDPIDRFIKSLTTEERTFLRKLMTDLEDAKGFLRSIGKSLSAIEYKINNKVAKYLDDPEGIFDEDGLLPRDECGEFEFNIDYEIDLREIL